MASKLDVDEIAAKNGTDPVTLTKQEAARTLCGFNLASGTQLVANNTSFSQVFNNSSVTDDATGEFSVNFTSNHSDDEYIVCGMAHFDNNCISAKYTSMTSAKVQFQIRDADAGSVRDSAGYASLFGDLA